jgi:hypothetical protein
MKLFKLSTALLLVTALFFTACKGKSAKDLIANKWHLTEVTGDGTKDMTAEQKKEMTDKLVMELSKDGKCSISGMGDKPQTGTYSLSTDGKTLNLTREGETAAEPQKIDELTAGKLVITDDKSKMQLSFKAQ